MIFTYNKEFVGDVLMVIVANNEDAKLSVERKETCTGCWTRTSPWRALLFL